MTREWNECAGLLPEIFLEFDPRSPQEQANERYAHGGGWRPFLGFTLHMSKVTKTSHLTYPGDPPCLELCRTSFRDKLIILFQHDWVAIVEPNETYEIARMD